MKKHLDAAYTEIGKLSVRLIEATLGIERQAVRNLEHADMDGEEERDLSRSDYNKINVMRSYQTPDDPSKSTSALLKYMASSTLEAEDRKEVEDAF